MPNITNVPKGIKEKGIDRGGFLRHIVCNIF
jgi:hypothetical protein